MGSRFPGTSHRRHGHRVRRPAPRPSCRRAACLLCRVRTARPPHSQLDQGHPHRHPLLREQGFFFPKKIHKYFRFSGATTWRNHELQNFTVRQCRRQPGTAALPGAAGRETSAPPHVPGSGRTARGSTAGGASPPGRCLSGPRYEGSELGLKHVSSRPTLSTFWVLHTVPPVTSYVRNTRTQSRRAVTHADHTRPDDKGRPGLVITWAPRHFPGAAAVPATARDWMHGARISCHHL